MNRILVVALVAIAVAAGLFYGRRTSDQSSPPPSPAVAAPIGATLLGAGLALTGGTLLVLPLFALKPDAAGPGGLAGAGVGFATEL